MPTPGTCVCQPCLKHSLKSHDVDAVPVGVRVSRPWVEQSLKLHDVSRRTASRYCFWRVSVPGSLIGVDVCR